MTDIAALGIKIDSTDVIRGDKALNDFAGAANKADKGVDNLKKATDRGKVSTKAYTESTAQAAKSNRRLQNSAQNASYQVADLAVQLEGGTSFARAFGQQGSQLLAAFGPYGAIAGAAVAVTAALASTFFDAGNSAQELAEEIDELVDSYERLDERQRQVKRIAISKKLKKERILRSKLIEKIREQTKALEEADAAEQKKLNSALLSNSTDLRRRNATAALRQEAKEEREKLQLLEGQLANSESRTESYNLALRKVNGTYQQSEQALFALAKAELDQLDAVSENNKAVDVSISNAERLVASLKDQAATLGQTTAQARLYQVASAEGVTPALIAEAKAAQMAIDAYNAKTAAQEAAKTKDKRVKEEQDQTNTNAQAIAESLLAEEEQIRLSLERRSQIVLESTIYTETEKAAVLADLAKQSAEQVEAIERDKSIKVLQANEQLFGGLASLAGAFAGEQSSLYKGLFAMQQGFAVAQALMNVPKSYSDAYAATVGIPIIGPALAPVAGATAAAAQVAQATQVKNISPPSFDGGGYTGDGARTGGLDGKGGFMAMLHPQETVSDHTKGQSNGGDVIIKISNYGGGETSSSQGPGEINLAFGNAERYMANRLSKGQGPLTQSIEQVYKVQRRGRS